MVMEPTPVVLQDSRGVKDTLTGYLAGLGIVATGGPRVSFQIRNRGTGVWASTLTMWLEVGIKKRTVVVSVVLKIE